MRNNAKKLTCDILNILWERTDKEHPISIQKLTSALDGSCETRPDRGTVASILNVLHTYFHGPGKVKCQESEKKNSNSYSHSYYLERDFTAEEVEMLINDVMFSRMRTEKQARALIEKLRDLISPYERKVLEYSRDLPCSLHTASPLVQKNIAFVQRVISDNLHINEKETVISFHFNGYGSDHQLHEVPEGKYHNMLPLKILENNDRYYIVGLLDGNSKIWNFRLDLITRLGKTERLRVKDAERDRAIQRVNDVDSRSTYLTGHLYMGYERENEEPSPVYLRVKKIDNKPEASLTILHDAFGRNYHVISENDQYADIRVESITWSITSFVRQHIDRVRVMGPEPMKKAVENALKKDFEVYFQKAQEEHTHYLLLLEAYGCRDCDEWLGIYHDDETLKAAYEEASALLQQNPGLYPPACQVAIYAFSPTAGGPQITCDMILRGQKLRKVTPEELVCFK